MKKTILFNWMIENEYCYKPHLSKSGSFYFYDNDGLLIKICNHQLMTTYNNKKYLEGEIYIDNKKL